MRINKNVSKVSIGCFVILLAVFAFGVYRMVGGYYEFVFDASTWIMLGVLFQNVIFVFGPKVGFENEEEQRQFMNKSDSNAFAIVCILLLIGGFFLDYSSNLKNLFFLNNQMAGIYLLMLATLAIFIRMLVYLISCLMYKGK